MAAKPIESEVGGGAVTLLHCPSCARPTRGAERFCSQCGTALRMGGDVAMPASVGEDRYRIVRLIGEGTKKRVFLARDVRLERDVAIAFVKTEGLDDVGVARVAREARAMAKLADHPGIVTVYDIGDDQGTPYIVCEHMQGGTIAEALDRAEGRRLPVERVLRLAIEIGRALEHAHGRGILHRDLKPANVWLAADGSAKLGDFGLALVAEHSRLTQEGMMVGTLAYLAPEQILGRELDARTDLYSFGAMLYELTTGRAPFVASDAAAVLAQHVQAAPVAPSLLNPETSAGLESVILRLLAKSPDERPQSAAEAVALLTDLSGGGASTEAAHASGEMARPTGVILVGRRAELGRLRDALEATISGRGRLVLLGGDPGIGKTRLAEELVRLAQSRGVQALVGRCQEGEGAPAFWPWLQVIRAYVSRRDPAALRMELGAGAGDVAQVVSVVRERLPDLPLPPPPSLDSERSRFRLFDSITTFLRNAAKSRPLLLVVDDLQWADPPSIQLLRFLAREAGSARLLVIATYRAGEIGADHPLSAALLAFGRETAVDRVALRGLTEEEIGELLDGLGGNGFPKPFVRAILRDSEGNPFFAGEMFRHLVEQGVVRRENDRWTSQVSPDETPLPDQVREVVGRRLARLSEPCIEALAVAAAIGREFALDLVARASFLKRERIVAALAEAESRHVLRRSLHAKGTYAFAHALVRETLYQRIPADERARLHRRIGEALEQLHADDPGPHLAEIAVHFHRALATGESDKATAYSVRAGERALGRLAYEEAAAHFERALAAVDRGRLPLTRPAADLSPMGRGESPPLPLGRGRSAAAGEGEASRRAPSPPPSPAARIDLLLRLAEALRRGGAMGRAKETYRQAAALAGEAGLGDLLARAALGLGAAGFGAALWGTLEVDEELVRLLRDARKLLGDHHPTIAARVASRLVREIYWSDAFELAPKIADEAVALCRGRENSPEMAIALAGRCYASLGPDRSDDHSARVDECVAVADRTGVRELVLQAQGLRFLDLTVCTDRETFDGLVDGVARLADELRESQYVWFASVLRAMQAIRDGRLGDAERLVRESQQRGEEADDRNAITLSGTQMGAVRFFQGRLPELEAAFRGFAERYPSMAPWKVGLALALCEAGRTDEAREIVADYAARDFADVRRDSLWLSSMHMLGIVAAATGHHAAAERAYERLRPYERRYVVAPPGLGSFGPVALSLALLAFTLGRFEEAGAHQRTASDLARRFGDRSVGLLLREIEAAILAVRAKGDPSRAREMLREVAREAAEIGLRPLSAGPWLPALVRRVADEAGTRGGAERLLTDGAATSAAHAHAPAARPGRWRRAMQPLRASLRNRALGAIGRTVRGRPDAVLLRRFDNPLALHSLFSLMAFSFRPERAFGFEGEIVYELGDPSGETPPSSSWTIAVGRNRARARRGAAEHPAVRIRVGTATLVRVAIGELSPVAAMLEGKTSVAGDLGVASRMVDMFGGMATVAPIAAREAHEPSPARGRIRSLLAEIEHDARASAAIDAKQSIELVRDRVVSRRPSLRAATAADGTTTILFSDVEGYTRMVESLGDAGAHAVLREHNRIVREELARHRGHEIELQGDGFLLAFASPESGLDCAIAIQRAFEAFNRGGTHHPFRVRMGLHSGEAIREAGAFFGKTVILAARIAARARGEQILISAAVRRTVAESGRFAFGRSDEIEIEGIAGRHEICFVEWREKGA